MSQSEEKPLFERKPEEEANPPPEQEVIAAATVEEPKEKTKKPSLDAGAKLAPIIPRNIDEMWRLAQAFYQAGMVPASYEVRTSKGGPINEQGTIARMMIGIQKGLEVGLPPVTALSTIMVVNNRPALWGDGAKALVQASGKCEFIREKLEGTWGDDMVATCEAKRKDQSEPITRTFSYQDAKKAGLTSKTGPWQSYGPRMLTVRAAAWVLRDAFSDALHGLAIAEEVRDFEVEARREAVTDTSDLDAPKQIEQSALPPIDEIKLKGEKVFGH